MTLATGNRLGTYERGPLIGEGGMGRVFRARDMQLDRDVAIKALPEEWTRDGERIARLEREARVLASLSHPNIAGIHHLARTDGACVLVMEYVPGDTLAQRIAGTAMPWEEARAMFRRARALITSVLRPAGHAVRSVVRFCAGGGHGRSDSNRRRYRHNAGINDGNGAVGPLGVFCRPDRVSSRAEPRQPHAGMVRSLRYKNPGAGRRTPAIPKSLPTAAGSPSTKSRAATSTCG